MKIFNYIKALLLRRFYYDEYGAPIKCEYCKSTRFIEKTRDDINGTVSEYSIHCAECGLDVGYWAYGYYDPSYKINIFLRNR